MDVDIAKSFASKIPDASEAVRGFFHTGRIMPNGDIRGAFKPELKGSLNQVIAWCREVGLGAALKTEKVGYASDQGNQEGFYTIVVLTVEAKPIVEHALESKIEELRESGSTSFCGCFVKYPEDIIEEELGKKSIFEQVKKEQWVPINLLPLRQAFTKSLEKLAEKGLINAARSAEVHSIFSVGRYSLLEEEHSSGSSYLRAITGDIGWSSKGEIEDLSKAVSRFVSFCSLLASRPKGYGALLRLIEESKDSEDELDLWSIAQSGVNLGKFRKHFNKITKELIERFSNKQEGDIRLDVYRAIIQYGLARAKAVVLFEYTGVQNDGLPAEFASAS